MDINIERFCVATAPRAKNGGFLIDKYVAVLFKASGATNTHSMLLSPESWANLQHMAKNGHFVILEAWQMGQCISN